MVLVNDFRFNQANLQDYLDCKRRFYFRYIHHLSWPAIESEPALEHEKWILDGADFHRLLQQYYLGLPVEKLSRQAKRQPLKKWWKRFLASNPAQNAVKTYPELILKLNFHGWQLVAKYDLVAVIENNSFVIYDWKTSRNKPQRDFVGSRLQTRIYPFVLAKNHHILLDGKLVEPENISMVYWYANFPESQQRFVYSKEKMEEDAEYILGLIKDIQTLEGIDQFPLTPDLKQCQYCVYRSLCDRGDKAGDIENIDPGYEINEDFSFDLLEEIEF